jgi:nucleotide-binding universal stress UspA family protein
MRILFATDGSNGALAVAGLVNRLNLTGDDEIRVLMALPATEVADGQKRLESTCAALQGSPARVTPTVGRGTAAEVILGQTDEWQPDLIAVGSRGMNAVARLFLGSVAERVVCHAPCPVLVARPLAEALDRVVVGIDGSAASLEAARLVQELPLPPECEILFATAMPLYQVGGTPAGRVPSLAAELNALQTRERQEAQARLDQIAGTLRDAGRRASTEFRERHPGEGLLEIAEERGADLIVVGRQGLSRIERFCMGSVSMNVLRHAVCSVLVVPESRSG